jgi:uncharacterized protein (TIGR00369 family)
MTARDEIIEALDGLSEERARTVLGWLRTVSRDREAMAEGGNSVGPLADLLGIVTETRSNGYSRMRCPVDPALFNPNGVLHGGVVYTLIDYGMGGAVMSALGEGEYCTSIEVKVSYLASVREGTLTAETQVVKEGRTIAFVESKVTDDKGRLVATGSASMFIFRRPQE